MYCANVQEELKILRLRYSMLQEEELENRERELVEMLRMKKEASVNILISYLHFCAFLIFHKFLHMMKETVSSCVEIALYGATVCSYILNHTFSDFQRAYFCHFRQKGL